jgi:hydroxymethylglutaryl-CoA reductase (NADPH)
MSATAEGRIPVPRDRDDDYTPQAAEARRAFVRERTGTELEHVGAYSFDPAILSGNVEQFVGVAQVPIGLAGPLLVNGEHAQGEFYVPLATAEGTLVASYNRGMRLLYEAGGVTTTIMADHMQRAPAFVFASAREARDFGGWLEDNFDAIKAAAESTTRSGRLQEIERYSAGRILFTRFNYTTGDAAGQNLTGKATQAACRWIREHRPDIEEHFLESNFATDKKSSQVNMLRTRGKPRDRRGDDPQRAVPADHAIRQLADVPGTAGVEPRRLHVRRQQQRRALRQRHHRDLHRDRPGRGERRGVLSGLRLRRAAPQRRLLLLGHDPVADRRDLRRRDRSRDAARVPGDARLLGRDRVRKLTEIVAATVLCGELSLGSAIVAEEWVDAHDLYGRNRPPG